MNEITIRILLNAAADGSGTAAGALHKRLQAAQDAAWVVGYPPRQDMFNRLHDTINRVVQSRNSQNTLAVQKNEGWNAHFAVRVPLDGKNAFVAVGWDGSTRVPVPMVFPPNQNWVETGALRVDEAGTVYMDCPGNGTVRITRTQGGWFGIPCEQGNGNLRVVTDDADIEGVLDAMPVEAGVVDDLGRAIPEWLIEVEPYDLDRLAAEIISAITEAETPLLKAMEAKGWLP